ncbi:MAG: SurA N-terminal domain-containing protein [Pirellulales bacterium]
MSNPFATFRKNQTYWMAALVLVAILSFIVAPAIDMVTNRNRGVVHDTSVVAYWNGGQITRKEIEDSLRRRVGVRNFLASVAKKVIAAGGKPAVPGFANFNGQTFVRGINDEISEGSVTEGKILLSMAERLGVEFDDAAADSFMKSYCDKKISDTEFNDLLKNAGINIFDVRQIIKQDLTTSTTMELLRGGSYAPSPDQLWQNFLKLNQQTKVEAYPVLVSAYMDKVSKKPTDSQLQELYESGKTNFSHPDMPNAGFARRDQFNIEYVESNYKAWVPKELAKINEVEMKVEYDRQVKAGLLKVPMDYKAPEPAQNSPAPAGTTSDTPPSVTPPAVTPSTAPTEQPAPAATTPAATTTPAAPGDAPATTPAPTTPAPTTPAPTTPAPTTPAPTTPSIPTPETGAPPQSTEPPAPATEPAPSTEPAPATEPAPVGEPKPSNSQSSKARQSDVKLVSFVQEATQEPAPASPAPAQEPVPTSPTPATTLTPAPTPEATGTPAPAAQETTAPVAQAPAADTNLPTAVPAQPPMRDMTYEEARDRILNYLAESHAREASNAASAVLQKAMEEYANKYRQYESMLSANLKDKKLEKPSKPDLKKFAAENGLIYGETGMTDQVKLAVTPFGGSFSFTNNGMIVANLATQIPNFYPGTSITLDGTNYNFWKTEFIAAEVPKFGDVRDYVEDWWKRIEARKLAEEAAVNMSKKLAAGQDPWTAVLSDTERALVVTTDSFTWMSRAGAEPRLTPVPKLDRVGYDFMKEVFSSEAGKFGVVANNPKTTYYVFRVLEKTPEQAELQKRFTEDPVRQAPRQLSNMTMPFIDWQAIVNKELNVQYQSAL